MQIVRIQVAEPGAMHSGGHCATTPFSIQIKNIRPGIVCRRAVPGDAEAFASWCMNAASSPFWPDGLTVKESV